MKTVCVKLPRDGPDYLGAAAFLALLAYPEGDRAKRDKVVHACKAHLVKAAKRAGAPPTLLRDEFLTYPVEKIRSGPISQAWRRIIHRRIPGAMMADILMLNRASSNHLRVRVKLGRQIVKENISAVADAVANEMEIAGIGDLTRQNMLTRVWKETAPVLHLAMALNAVIRKLPSDPISFFTLLNHPDWVRQAIASAENIRKMFPAFKINAGSIQLSVDLD